jgi:uncharacterized protein
MTTASDATFVDTNILVYAADQSAAFHSVCRALLDRGLLGQERLVLSPQVLSEFISVVTNSNVTPSPLSSANAYAHAEVLAKSFELIVPSLQVFDRALDLLRKTGIAGKRVHDVMHAATMLENGITRIYTFDSGFSKIPGITVSRP